jgi:hypothetical protein
VWRVERQRKRKRKRDAFEPTEVEPALVTKGLMTDLKSGFSPNLRIYTEISYGWGRVGEEVENPLVTQVFLAQLSTFLVKHEKCPLRVPRPSTSSITPNPNLFPGHSRHKKMSYEMLKERKFPSSSSPPQATTLGIPAMCQATPWNALAIRAAGWRRAKE